MPSAIAIDTTSTPTTTTRRAGTPPDHTTASATVVAHASTGSSSKIPPESRESLAALQLDVSSRTSKIALFDPGNHD
jgi:hypothetical protein